MIRMEWNRGERGKDALLEEAFDVLASRASLLVQERSDNPDRRRRLTGTDQSAAFVCGRRFSGHGAQADAIRLNGDFGMITRLQGTTFPQCLRQHNPAHLIQSALHDSQVANSQMHSQTSYSSWVATPWKVRYHLGENCLPAKKEIATNHKKSRNGTFNRKCSTAVSHAT